MRLLSVFLATIVVLGWFSYTDAATSILQGVIRDQTPRLKPTDFEINNARQDRGIVTTTLGADNKPVYAHGPNPSINKTVISQDTFYTWFHNTNRTKNILYNITLSNANATLTGGNPNVYCYQNSYFFPINGKGWGNEGYGKNYHFCMETHGTFNFTGTEVFSFTGDDDVWVYINKKLVVDLGGIHAPQTASVDVSKLGLTKGREYQFDFFYCERHTPGSSIKLCTSLVIECGYYDWCGLCNGDGQSCCTGANNCDDGDSCTNDFCDKFLGASKCTHTQRTCNDNNPCTVDSCSNGQCMNVPKCNDNNMCTMDTCNTTTGVCATSPISCDDGVLCSVDTCDPLLGCQHTSGDCDDNDLCTVDACTGTGCSNTPVVCPGTNRQCRPSDGACVCADGYFGASCDVTCEDLIIPERISSCSGDSAFAVFNATRVGAAYTVSWSESCANASFNFPNFKNTRLNAPLSCGDCDVTLSIMDSTQTVVDSCTRTIALPVCNATKCTNCPAGQYFNPIAGRCVNDNAMTAFGYSAVGAMGLATTNYAATPLLVPYVPNRNVIVVGTSARHSALITNLGEVYMAGANDAGQLGTSDYKQRNNFTIVNGLPTTAKAVSVGLGLQHTIVFFDNGEVWGFGSNWKNQIGVPGQNVYITPVQIVIQTTGGAPIRGVAAGFEHSIFFTSTEVYTCGNGDKGATGLQYPGQATTPARALTAPVGETFIQVAAGGWSGMALTDMGKVYVWGNNQYGNLGLGDNLNRKYPTLNTNLLPATLGAQVTYITMAEQHSLFMTGTKELYSTGNNTFGQLGLGDTVNRNRPTKIPFFAEPAFPGTVRGVSNGFRHSMVWTADHLYVFGSNLNANVGLGNTKTIHTSPVINTYYNNKRVVVANSKGEYSLVLAEVL